MNDYYSRGYERFAGRIGEFSSESSPWWPQTTRARQGVPNVVVVLIDDLGFSDLGPYGSEIETPNIDRLADEGWIFTNYRTAPLCSPARAALLTGINSHRAGFGYVSHTDPGYPGFSCTLPVDAPTLAESLRAGGYATFMVGKWHLTPEMSLHDAGDRSSWPLQRGFDRYFGSMDGFTSLHHPHRLVRDNSVVDIPEFPPGYFLTDELTNEAVTMIDQLRSNDSSKPFFLYFAHTAVHGPVQAKPVDIAKYRGRYEEGWNRIRSLRFDRQRQSGIVSAQAELPEGTLADSDQIPEWESLSHEEQQLFARHMEVYAASVDEVDQSIGRLLAALDRTGERDNTLFIVTSDNGGTSEGGPRGTRSYFAQFGHAGELPSDWVTDVSRDVHDIGGPRVWGHYPAGWGRVSNTPYRSFKGSTYEGGVHAPLVVSWPAAPVSPGRGVRDQFVYVTDLAPTILDLVGVESLTERQGIPAQPIDGVSAASILSDPAQPGRDSQYFECMGRRALVDGEWKAVSSLPPSRDQGAAGGAWELYNLASDPTELRDCAENDPERTLQMAEQWRSEAWRNTVFPLDDSGMHSVRPASLAELSNPVTVPAFRPPLERFRSAQLTVLKSFVVEIDLHIHSGAEGTVLAHGDQGGGYAVVIDNGVPAVSYNAYGVMFRGVGETLGVGEHSLELRVDELPQLRWRLRLFVDGRVGAEIAQVPMLFGMAPFTGISVGYDYGSPVDWEYHQRAGSNPLRHADIVRVRYVPGRRSRHDHTVLRSLHDEASAIAD